MARFRVRDETIDNPMWSTGIAYNHLKPNKKLQSYSYLMESLEESIRIELKTDPEIVRKQAMWCGLKSGLKVLDVGCGPGKTSAILHEMIQPDGELLGMDFSVVTPRRLTVKRVLTTTSGKGRANWVLWG